MNAHHGEKFAVELWSRSLSTATSLIIRQRIKEWKSWTKPVDKVGPRLEKKYKKIEALTNVTEQSRHNPLMISTLSVVYLLCNTKSTIIHQTVVKF